MDKQPNTPLDFIVQQLQRAQAALKEDDFSSLKDALDFATGIATHWQPYLDQQGPEETAERQALRIATENTDWSALYEQHQTQQRLRNVMCSDAYQVQVLQMLLHLTHAKNVLEIGMFTGYSALGMAEALPADGRVTTLELDPFLEDFATPFFATSAFGKRITVKVGDALATLKKLRAQQQQYDFIFLDADKASYQKYYDFILSEQLLAPEGTLVVDNCFMKGKVFYIGKETCVHSKAIREFNAHVKQDDRVTQVLIPVRDGLMVIRRVK